MHIYRFLLFTYSDYYPSGGMDDCIFKTNNIDTIEKFINDDKEYTYRDNLYVYDIKEDKTIHLDYQNMRKHLADKR